MIARNNPRNWRCECCSVVSADTGLLRAPSPFDPDDELVGCPSCKQTEGFIELCEIDGCLKGATCGGPGEDGIYRRTCGNHAYWLRNRPA